MNDSLGVCGVEGIGNLTTQIEHLIEGQRLLAHFGDRCCAIAHCARLLPGLGLPAAKAARMPRLGPSRQLTWNAPTPEWHFFRRARGGGVVERYFKLAEDNTTIHRELLGGLTTFLTMRQEACPGGGGE
jgi:hypothetical protein